MTKANVTVDLNYIRDTEQEIIDLKQELRRVKKDFNDSSTQYQNEIYSLRKELEYAKVFLAYLRMTGKLEYWKKICLNVELANPDTVRTITHLARDMELKNDGWGNISIESKRFNEWHGNIEW